MRRTKKIELDLRGEFTTLEDLNKIRLKYAHRANERLRALERANQKASKSEVWDTGDEEPYTGFAYKVATQYTQTAYGRNRFSEKKNLTSSPFELIEETENIIKFLNSQTSTITGYRELQAKILDTFKTKHKIDIPKSESEDWFNFLSDKTFQELSTSRNVSITSGQIQDFYYRAKQNDVKSEDIKKAMEAFKKRNVKTVDVLYEEVGINFFDYVGTEED